MNVNVHLRPVTSANIGKCLNVKVREDQKSFVAPVTASLNEVFVNPNLTALAIYDVKARGWESTDEPVVGFAVYEVVAGVGFILRLTIDEASQRKGYGRAAMIEMIRRLRLIPEVEIIATSHRLENEPMAQMCEELGFVDWEIEFAKDHLEERFLLLAN